MALTPEQQQHLEFQAAQAIANETENIRNRRIDAIRIAKEILMENDRNKPVGERGITAQDITTFAEQIVNYIKQ